MSIKIYETKDPMDPNFVALDPVKLLIIDYDVTRFHSFDFFRWALLNRELFYSVVPAMQSFARDCHSVADQVNFYRLNADSFNPLDNFTTYLGQPGNNHQFLVENLVAMMTHPRAKTTVTDFEYQFDIVFENRMVDGTLLQFKEDPHKPQFVDRCKIQREQWDDILDLKRLVEYTMDNHFNAVMCGPLEVLAPYLTMLSSRYKIRMQVFYGKYGYNLEWHQLGNQKMRMMRKMLLFAKIEDAFRYAFASFDPFSKLTHNEAVIRREQRLQGENQDG